MGSEKSANWFEKMVQGQEVQSNCPSYGSSVCKAVKTDADKDPPMLVCLNCQADYLYQNHPVDAVLHLPDLGKEMNVPAQ